MSKILVIRSAGMTFERGIRSLQEDYPDHRIDVLVTPDVDIQTYSNRYPELSFIDIDQGERFGVGSVSSTLLDQLRNKQYERVFILFNYRYEHHHLAVENLAREIQPTQVVGLDYYGEQHTLSKWGFPVRKLKSVLSQWLIGVVNNLFRYPLGFYAVLLARFSNLLSRPNAGGIDEP